MSTPITVVEGTIRPDGTLEPLEKLDLPAGRVQVTLVPIPDLPGDDPFWQRMTAMWVAQKARGHVPRTEADVEADRGELRLEWEERMARIARIQEEADRPRPGRRHFR
jgi:hypothetical protein